MGHPLGRLKRREDFLRVAAARKKCVTNGFVLQACASPDNSDDLRVGFTASRKVGGAVDRNRTKRRLRVAAARVLPELGKPGTDYVLIGRRDTATMPFATLENDLRQAVAKISEARPIQK
ncbi:MAG: ribonuclease P protein component [Rhodospirillaceae bacterium]|nr:ribonuclease P protein component [Rhodospirillaceae bacterium]